MRKKCARPVSHNFLPPPVGLATRIMLNMNSVYHYAIAVNARLSLRAVIRILKKTDQVLVPESGARTTQVRTAKCLGQRALLPIWASVGALQSAFACQSK
jgi:hypothetical protein